MSNLGISTDFCSLKNTFCKLFYPRLFLLLPVLLLVFSSAVEAQYAAINCGAYPGPYWNYGIQSTNTAVSFRWDGPLSGFYGRADGGYSPYVVASIWGTTGDSYGAAFMDTTERWSIRVVPGPMPDASGSVPIGMSFVGIFNAFVSDTSRLSQWPSASGSIWGPQPVSGGDGWGAASGGGFAISWDTDPAHWNISASASPTFLFPYNQWVTFQIHVAAGSAFYYPGPGYDVLDHSYALIDPTFALSPDWLAAHPGDHVEMLSLSPVAPMLTITNPAPHTVTLSWPLPDVGWKLQATTNLSGAPVWTEIPPPYGTNSTSLIFTEPSSQNTKFYRLHYQ